jgi:hypothetical protein
MNYVLISIAAFFLASCTLGHPEKGDKIGQIAKVQVEGILCKTTSILITGKFGGGELRVTVPDKLYSEVKRFNETQEFVKVTYHRNLIGFSCSNETSNRFLDTVEAHPLGAPG